MGYHSDECHGMSLEWIGKWRDVCSSTFQGPASAYRGIDNAEIRVLLRGAVASEG